MSIRVGVLGFGYWAPKLVRVLTQIVGVENVSILECAAHRRDAACEQFPGIRTLADLDEILIDREIEAMFVCTPARTHFDIAKRLLLAGRHVFIEKPFTTSAEEAGVLFQIARERSLVAYPGHIFLHSPYFSGLKELLAGDELGDLRYAVARRGSLGPRAREDINATWDYLIHDVYVFNALLNGPPLQVTARGAAYLRKGVEDVCFAVLEYPNQFLINLYSSWYAPEKIRSLLLVGSKAMLDYDELRPQPWRVFACGYRQEAGTDQHGNFGLRLFDDGARSIPSWSEEEPLKREIATFLDHVEKREAAAEMEQHVLEVTETMEAINLSMRAGGAPATVHRLPRSNNRKDAVTERCVE